MIFSHETISFWQKAPVGNLHDLNTRKFSNIILMQSTGLKDKNGVEIYGDDVVKGLVEWNLGYCIMKGRVIHKKGGWRVDGTVAGCDRCFPLIQFSNLECITNIHANPELRDSKGGE